MQHNYHTACASREQIDNSSQRPVPNVGERCEACREAARKVVVVHPQGSARSNRRVSFSTMETSTPVCRGSLKVAQVAQRQWDGAGQLIVTQKQMPANDTQQMLNTAQNSAPLVHSLQRCKIAQSRRYFAG
jgi:hypothetical protein